MKKQKTKEEKLAQRVMFNSTKDLEDTLLIKNDLSTKMIFSIPELNDEKSAVINMSRHLPKDNIGLIHIAAYFDSLECLKLLLANGCTIDQKSTHGFTPLHYACAGPSIETALYLIHNGANVNASSDSCSCLFFTATSGCASLLNVLFDYEASLDGPSSKGQTKSDLIHSPLNYAIRNKFYDCAEIMLARGYKPSTTDGQLSPLMQAITIGLNEVIRPLLENGADPNYTTKTGLCPVCLAIRKNDITVLKMLLEKGGRINFTCVGQGGGNAVHAACAAGNLEIYKLAVEMGVNPLALDDNGKPASFAVLLAPNDKMIPLWAALFEAGVNINAIGRKDSSTILMDIITDSRKRSPEVIEFLLANGADLNMIAANKQTCYEMATKICRDNKEIMEKIEKYHRHPVKI